MNQAEYFYNLFRGMDEAHGTYEVTGTEESGKKSGRALTLREMVTPALWALHLAGKQSLGIIPINRESKAKWGAIDIDEYPVDHAGIIARVRELKLPLNVFCSKSGGAHLILILDEPIEARRMSSILKSWCAALKLGKVEVFPKQAVVRLDEGDLGNWLNMPYFGQSRPLLTDNGTPVPVEVFPEAVIVTPATDVREHKLKLEDSPIKDGPPCLQTLSLSGFPEGGRNNGLFNLGIYAKRSNPNHWKQVVIRYNQELLKPPLDKDEVALVINQLDKTDYKYRCHDQPINMFCNASVCRGRKYGIGDGALPIISGVTKIFNPNGGSEWWLEIGDKRISVNAEELNSKEKFGAKLTDIADIVLPDVKPAQWKSWVRSIVDQAKDTPLVVPFHDTLSGQFLEHFRQFLTQRATSVKADLAIGKVWYDTERRRAVFRLKDLIHYLSRKRFVRWSDSRCAAELTKVFGASTVRPRAGESRDYAYAVDFDRVEIESLPEPKQVGEVL